jgi:zinc transporter, ZIP family
MSLSTTLLLGFIAGVTILIGLPVGRFRAPAPGLRTFLNAAAVGVLIFLVWDVLSGAWEPVDTRLTALSHHGPIWPVVGYMSLFVGGVAVGLLALVGYELWMNRQAGRSDPRTGEDPVPFGPGAMSVLEVPRSGLLAGWSPARRLALLIAVGIGLHNFAEGLAIGQSAASGEAALATLLVVGFGLHNATEGFGIVAPLAADSGDDTPASRHGVPSWPFLLSLAAIGGGPTFVGTAVGYNFTSDPVSVIFLTLAAGSILYVVIALLGIAAKSKRADLVAYGVLLGLVAGFVTDAIVTAGGV